MKDRIFVYGKIGKPCPEGLRLTRELPSGFVDNRAYWRAAEGGFPVDDRGALLDVFLLNGGVWKAREVPADALDGLAAIDAELERAEAVVRQISRDREAILAGALARGKKVVIQRPAADRAPAVKRGE
jgi:hypothetical protein